MKKGQIISVEDLRKDAVLLGGGETPGDAKDQERWVELHLWKIKPKRGDLLGESFLLTGRKPHGEHQRVVDVFDDFDTMIDVRRKISRKQMTVADRTKINTIIRSLTA
jgi:hypothetical protein